ncbi:hypothetical protein PIB30_000842 [Stylosanthes scabra]|uniref:C-CAP/cofactor C-like domain-containing protein n=1 Tax=Stylosanthes scabra TaxID=79078 RepID=A0ABU6R337_9FABA|nr:hypothetical protein [Stylosanthes scabra]
MRNFCNNESESESSSSSPAFESTSSYLTRFSNLKSSIESQLTHSHSLSTSDPSQLKSHFEQISASISHLENLVAQNSYDVRSSLKTIADLKHALEALTSELLPKKKFSFKNKPATKKDTTNNNTTVITPQESKQQLPPNPNRDSPGFRNKSGEVLAGVRRLKNSRVYVGHVMGSVLIEDVEGCVFAMASHQIRIHGATRSDFYLRVRSRPIIEDSNGVRLRRTACAMKGWKRICVVLVLM